MITKDDLQHYLVAELLCAADTNWVLGHWFLKVIMNGRSLTDCTAFAGMAQDTLGHTRALFQILEDWNDMPDQQLEFGRGIEKIHSMQVLDKPQVPLGPTNIKLKLSVFLAGILGIGLGIAIGFVRAYTHNSDMDERKKLRRVKYFFKKKTKDIILDRRVSGIVSILLLIGLPFYLGYESKNPVFFGMYSAKLMIVNTIYVIGLLFSLYLFIHLTRKKIN